MDTNEKKRKAKSRDDMTKLQLQIELEKTDKSLSKAQAIIQEQNAEIAALRAELREKSGWMARVQHVAKFKEAAA